MAKSNSFFGLRRGSTKSLTFQVLNGKQVTKDRVTDVKNPRSSRQMSQRMILATVSAAYSAFKAIVDHSFEGVTYGQNSMSFFQSKNAALLKDYDGTQARKFAYNPYQDRNLYPGCYLMAKGSLPVPSYHWGIVTTEDEIGIGIDFAGVAGERPTASEFADILGLTVGEMNTWCVVYYDSEDGQYKFGYTRITCDMLGDTILSADNFADFFTVESTFEQEGVTFAQDTLTIGLKANKVANSPVQSCVIYSRPSTNGWLRSTAYLDAPEGLEFNPTKKVALASYPQGKEYILNGGNF